MLLRTEAEASPFVGQEDAISIITRGGSQHTLATGFKSVRGIAISYVPESSSGALLGLGFAVTLLMLRRQRRGAKVAGSARSINVRTTWVERPASGARAPGASFVMVARVAVAGYAGSAERLPCAGISTTPHINRTAS